MTRRARRLLALGVVLATTVLALAAVPAPSPDVRADPEVVVVEVPAGGSATGAATLANHGDAATMITALVASGDCAGVGVMPDGFRLGSESEGAASQQALAITCAPPGFGIHRCELDAEDNATRRAALSVLCVAGNGAGELTADATDVDFGSVVIGATPAQRTITLTNTSATALSSLAVQLDERTVGGSFGIGDCLGGAGCTLATNVPPGGQLPIVVSCAPQALGLIEHTLYLVGGDGQDLTGGIPLRCTGAGAAAGGITVTPTSLPLSQRVGASITGALTVQNTSTTTEYAVQSTSIFGAAATQWSVTSTCALPCTLNPGTSLTLTATFTPAAYGPQDATLSILTNDPAAMTVDRDLDGTGLGATLELASDLGDPPSFHVTTRPIGVTGDRVFQLRNGGNVALAQLTYTITQAGTDFAMVAPPSTIAPGATADVRVACTPSAAGDLTATLEIRSDDPSTYAGSPRTVELGCTGTAGDLYVEPSAIDFGEVRIAPGAVVTQTITLRTGAGALPITSAPALTANPSGTLSVTAPTDATVAVGEPYTTFDVVLDPAADTPSLATTISITADDDDTIEIPVIGKITTPAVTVPDEVMIGSFCVGRTPATAEARMTSVGTATIGLPAKPYFAAMAQSGFNLDPGSYPASLAPGQSATVRVRPLGRDTAGIVTDTLVWSTDIEGELAAPMTTMAAEFIENGGAISPQRVDFGRVTLHAPAQTATIRIQNCGVDPLSLGEPTISPEGEFRDESTRALPSMLAPNAIATVVVGFVPTQTGTRNGSLAIPSSEGDLIVTLTGVGLGTDTTAPEKTSFYACDCTSADPAGAWPVLVVVFALRRRRRRAPTTAHD